MKTFTAAACFGLLTVSAAQAAPGDELVGNSLQVRQLSSPHRSVLHFYPGGRVLVVTLAGQRRFREDGRWSVGGGRICFDWRSSPNECWTYPAAIPVGRPVETARTDGSMRAVATLVAGHTVAPPAVAASR